MSDERTTGADEAARRGGASRDERLDRLVTALAEARPVLDDLTRARIGAKLAATTRKWAVGSATRPPADPTDAEPQPVPVNPAPGLAVQPRHQARELRGRTRRLAFVLGLVIAGIVAAALAITR